MDKTGEELHETIAPWRRGRLPSAADSIILQARPVTAQPSEPLRRAFGRSPWRAISTPASGVSRRQSRRALDHGLLLQSGEAWLDAGDERRQILGPAFVWSPAGTVDRLVIEAGGSGHLLQSAAT